MEDLKHHLLVVVVSVVPHCLAIDCWAPKFCKLHLSMQNAMLECLTVNRRLMTFQSKIGSFGGAAIRGPWRCKRVASPNPCQNASSHLASILRGSLPISSITFPLSRWAGAPLLDWPLEACCTLGKRIRRRQVPKRMMALPDELRWKGHYWPEF